MKTKIFLITVFLLLSSLNVFADYKQDKINILILSDGFIYNEQSFNNSVDKIKQSIEKDDTFSKVKDTFKYEVLFTKKLGFTSFGVSDIDRLVTVTNWVVFNEIIKDKTYNKIIIIKDDTKYGGSCSGNKIITITTNELMDKMLLHELGHTFGLSDEYWLEDIYKPAEGINKSSIKKPDWVSFGIKTEEQKKWFKPSNFCRMGNLNYGFCSICENHILSVVNEMTKEELKPLPKIAGS